MEARMSTRNLALTLVAVGALLTVAAGCGDDDETLSKAEVIKRGSAICKAGERKVNALPQPRSENPFAKDAPKGDPERARRFIAGYGEALNGVRTQLAELELPEQDKEQLEGFIADLGPTVKRFRDAARAAAQRNYKAAEIAGTDGFRRFEEASKKTAAYGFPKGVCQTG
jgi:hypothetical protein